MRDRCLARLLDRQHDFQHLTPAERIHFANEAFRVLKKGAKATVTNSLDMKNFESPTLKRKFDVIAFGMLADGSAPAADAKPGMAAPKSGASAHGGRAEVKGPIKVAKAAGPDGRTIAECWLMTRSPSDVAK